MTQDDLAKALDVHPMTVSSWERAIYGPGKVKAVEIITLLTSRPVRSDQQPFLETALATLRNYIGMGDGTPAPTASAAEPQRQAYIARTDALRRLPDRAKAVAVSYLARLEELRLTESEIESAERLMVETRDKLNAPDPRVRSEDEMITDIHAGWDLVLHFLRKRGLHP